MYGNNTGVINPTGGAYGYQYSTQDINIARSFTNNIMNNGATRRWTH
jgi:hypothetical protein